MDQDCKVSSGNHSQSSDHDQEESIIMGLRRGPWTVEEDFTLINYIAHHGEGRWNSLARCAGLRRTGKSCRLRWLNYLRPDVRRGNITLEEQLLILELHSRWGNRWSKIAQHLPGRTDNEIKNYWRTRVQKHAKQLKCDVNSKQFKDTMRYLWMPRLVERIQAAANNGGGATTVQQLAASSTATNSTNVIHMHGSAQITEPQNIQMMTNYTSENSSAAASSMESMGTPASDLTTDCYNNYPTVNQGNTDYYRPANQLSDFGDDDDDHHQSLISPTGYFNQGTLDFITEQQQNSQWMDGTYHHVSNNLWDVDDMWFLQQQF